MPGSVTADRKRSAKDVTFWSMVPPQGGPTVACYTGRSRQPNYAWVSVRGVGVRSTRGRPDLVLTDRSSLVILLSLRRCTNSSETHADASRANFGDVHAIRSCPDAAVHDERLPRYDIFRARREFRT